MCPCVRVCVCECATVGENTSQLWSANSRRRPTRMVNVKCSPGWSAAPIWVNRPRQPLLSRTTSLTMVEVGFTNQREVGLTSPEGSANHGVSAEHRFLADLDRDDRVEYERQIRKINTQIKSKIQNWQLCSSVSDEIVSPQKVSDYNLWSRAWKRVEVTWMCSSESLFLATIGRPYL